MKKTTKLLAELERCRNAMQEYEKSYDGLGEDEFICQNPYHAAAKRATMDLTRTLAEWRKAWTMGKGPK